MVHIDNLKEKELLIAHYFCGKSRKELTPVEVYDMWSNWFKNDFRINNQPTFKVVNDKLVYREEAKVKKDKSICKKYSQAFQNIYIWIKRTLDTGCHDKVYFKQELDKERNREYGSFLYNTKCKEA